ncbi:MAG: Gfo/Idh/MocA family oxidoreductase [Bryobacteraceae bacterium]|nr:Gfo/Idh/MocA family oxidoreductase [Bryobacteraceae bacterium]
MRVAIVGCGLIGGRRARSLGGCRLVACCDSIPERALGLARQFPGAESSADWRQTATRPDVDIVVVAATHNMLAPVAAEAAAAGKHVLVEKPGARRPRELDAALDAARRTGAVVRVGYNHRYHRAMVKAREIFDSGELGEPMFLRARYGHGGRPGYENEWRADPELSGGGELLDQGSHLIDLARWFLGEFVETKSYLGTFFWKMPVEDNCFLLLRTRDGKVAQLHASWSEWKNTFSLEIYGREGKLEISGLGGSYGVERLAFYRMSAAMGPPETTIWEYPMADNSWAAEFDAFLEDIRLGRESSPGLADARAALTIIESVYRESGL